MEEPSGADVVVSAGMSCGAGGHSVGSVTALTSSLLTAAMCRLSNPRALPAPPCPPRPALHPLPPRKLRFFAHS